jgi:uncharacterized membrane protein
MLIFAGLGLLYIVLSIPMIQRRVRRNPWYGFRTRKTLSNDRIWYAANEHSGRMLFFTGLVTLFSAILMTPLGFFSQETYALVCTIVMVATLVYTTYLSFKYLRRL